MPRKIDEGLSRVMATMGFVCAILVVMIHADVAATGWQGQVMQVIRGVTRIAVPWFFLVAGFFLAGHMDEKGWWKREVLKRVKTLLVPFFCWLFIYRLYDLILNVIAKCVGYDFGGGAYLGLGSEIVYLLGVHPFRLANVIWFLRALFLLVVLSPLLCSSSRIKTVLLLLVLFILYAGHEMGLDSGNVWIFFEYFLSLRGLFYFSVGLALRHFNVNIGKSVTFIMAALGIGAFFLYLKSCHPVRFASAGLCDVLMIPFILYAAYELVGQMCISKRLASMSLPVYLLHFPALIALTGVFSLCHMKAFFTTSLLAFGIKVFLVVPFAVAVALLIRKSPRLTSCLWGGRV